MTAITTNYSGAAAAASTTVSTEREAFLALPLPREWVHLLAEEVAQIIRKAQKDRPDYMTTEQVALYLRWSKKRIDNLCSQRRIPYRKDGNRRIFIRQEIDEWVLRLDGQTVQNALALAY